jgi:hypothetical protein
VFRARKRRGQTEVVGAPNEAVGRALADRRDGERGVDAEAGGITEPLGSLGCLLGDL